MNAAVLHEKLPTAFVDLETTGMRADVHRITEIAIVEAAPGGAVNAWSTLINPGREMPAQISALTGIDDVTVADAPYFEDIWREVYERLDGRLFVAHNVHFDYGFLRHAFAALGRAFRPQRVCTVRLSRSLYPAQRAHNLDALVECHNLTCEPRHRALTDARAIWEWCVKATADRGAAAMAAAVARQLTGPTLPASLDPARIDALVNGPGVYLFKGADDALLYVGKSVHLRQRVLSHLGEAERGGRGHKMLALVHDVDTIETAGELGAALLEASLVKRKAPLFNRRLRRHAQGYTLALAEDGDGFARPRVATLDRPVDEAGGRCYGLFRQRAMAGRRLQALADTHGLCRKILGLETGPGACVAYQLARCGGACVGKQAALVHNLKLLEALGPDRVPDWPFPGPVAVTERHGRLTVQHVLDRWCHLGSAARRQDMADIAASEPHFDLDVYRILHRHLARAASRLEVTLL